MRVIARATRPAQRPKPARSSALVDPVARPIYRTPDIKLPPTVTAPVTIPGEAPPIKSSDAVAVPH